MLGCQVLQYIRARYVPATTHQAMSLEVPTTASPRRSTRGEHASRGTPKLAVL